jgi:hypothetical protein
VQSGEETATDLREARERIHNMMPQEKR